MRAPAEIITFVENVPDELAREVELSLLHLKRGDPAYTLIWLDTFTRALTNAYAQRAHLEVGHWRAIEHAADIIIWLLDIVEITDDRLPFLSADERAALCVTRARLTAG
ncbi:MAG: hypothetical protein OJF49_002790 [Ktedonobacterales bacterium]|jgi:hypothetical protein|nr:MAG: hypothetical protein OJF49_002790 [Ktedonobacterales bacterium]